MRVEWFIANWNHIENKASYTVDIPMCALKYCGTGGVSYTVGGAAAPPTLRFATPTLCFAPPTFRRFGDFLALKQCFFTLAKQICHICRHFDIQFLVLQQNIQSMSHFAPATFSEKLHPCTAVLLPINPRPTGVFL